MVGVVLVSENREAVEMLKTTRRLVGRLDGFASVILRVGQSSERMASALKKAIRKVDTHKGCLVLYDFFGSTQCNVCRRFLKRGAIELVTGFNLSMLVKLGLVNKTMPIGKLAPFIERYGREHINHLGTKRSVCC